MTPADWPWYEVVEGDSLDQGDIIPGCLVLHAVEGENGAAAVADLRPVTALVLTQTCDLAQSKVESVIVCAVWPVTTVVLQDPVLRKEAAEAAQRNKLSMPAVDAADADARITEIIDRCKAIKKELNAIIKGERPPFAMLEKHDGVPSAALSMASFQHVYSLPRPVLARMAQKASPRLRLLPPYREHVSQAFGRYFSRIGLLQDIPRYPT
ncbi:MAG: hypothetical protein HYV09_02600 [Deltaproteobacteria bacterium]|nr:hypothetical protein [Deltaproteobacteria bacterium]